MLQYVKSFITLLLLGILGILGGVSHAGPWFTGPILAPAGHTVPRGHTNFEIYGLDVYTNGIYDNNGHISPIPLFKSFLISPLLTHGFTDWLDIQVNVPYAFNSTQGKNYNRLTDTSVGAGFQLLEQKKSKWLPDLRVQIQETFPTGKYDFLNPALLGVDATGLGSYRTLFSLNFQYLKEIYDSHYLRTRLILSTLLSSSVHVDGFNSFGGTSTTHGTVNPGSEENIDLAFEYTLTQNWVAVMEGYYSEGQSTRFNGILDIVTDGFNISSSNVARNYMEYGLAPALEYNFTESVGLIGGVWFPVIGKNTSHFVTYVLALNAYW